MTVSNKLDIICNMLEINGGMTMKNREVKNKVMGLGNRLSPRMGGDRTAAFVQAWAICKAGGLGNKGRGVKPRTHKNIKERL